MSTSKVKAGEAYVEIGIRNAVDKGLKAASASLNKWGKSVGVAGAAFSAAGASVLAPLTAATLSFASAGDKLDKMSARTGVAVETLSGLAFAAEQSGTGIDDLEKGLKRLSTSIEGVGRGVKMSVDAFGALGISADQIAGKSPEEAMLLVAESLSKVEDAALKSAYAQQIFGRAGTMLLPMFAGGAAGMKALTDEAAELGRVMSKDDATAAAQFTDAMNRVRSIVVGVKNQIGAALAPSTTFLADSFSSAAKVIIPFVRENRSLVVTVAAVAAGIVAFGAAISALGVFLMTAGAALGGVAGLIAFLLNPITLVIGGLAALAGAFFYYTDYASGAIKYLSERFGPLIKAAQDAAAIIMEAFASGDFSEAWDAAMLFVETAWLDLTNNLMVYWDGAMNYLTDVTATVASLIGKAFEKLGQYLKTMLDGYASYYDKVWNAVTKKLGEANGVRTIGGPVNAFQQDFGGTASQLTSLFAGVEQFGATMQQSAENNRVANRRDIEGRDKERRERLDKNRKTLEVGAEEAKLQAAKRLEGPKKPGDPIPELDELAGGSGRGGPSASFSAAAAAVIGAGPRMEDEQLKAMRETAANTRRIAKQNRDQNGRFE